MRRRRASRLVTFVTLLLGVLAAPVGALAHGVAHLHEAEHRAEQVLAGLSNDGAELEAADRHADHTDVHLDGGMRVRGDCTAVPSGQLTLPAAHELEATARSLPARRTLSRADRSTGPPPRLRAPPVA